MYVVSQVLLVFTMISMILLVPVKYVPPVCPDKLDRTVRFDHI